MSAQASSTQANSTMEISRADSPSHLPKTKFQSSIAAQHKVPHHLHRPKRGRKDNSAPPTWNSGPKVPQQPLISVTRKDQAGYLHLDPKTPNLPTAAHKTVIHNRPLHSTPPQRKKQKVPKSITEAYLKPQTTIKTAYPHKIDTCTPT